MKLDDMVVPVGIGLSVVVVIMTVLWLYGLRTRNFSYVDIGWSANFVVLAVVFASFAPGWPWRRWLIAAMYMFWGLRLAMHLAGRIIGEPEEGRYVRLREEWRQKGNLNARFLAFHLFQGFLNVFLALPMLLACMNPSPALHPLEIAGVAVWIIGLYGETLADQQLAAFKLSPEHRSKVCNTGLWRYSRHPNYFFEWTIWIGYALFALASPAGWLAILMPVLMLHFLINVTGVKPTEEQALRSRGDAYRAYQATTSAFIPLPPRAALQQHP